MELIRAGLGDDSDDTAASAAILQIASISAPLNISR